MGSMFGRKRKKSNTLAARTRRAESQANKIKKRKAMQTRLKSAQTYIANNRG